MEFLYEGRTPWPFLILTVFLGGGAAWLTGRALALTWRPFVQAVIYALLLAAATRFLHFALGDGRLTSLYYYVVDAILLIAAASLGFRHTRARQMTTQYYWLYERTGPFSWRERGPEPAAGSTDASP